MANLALNNNHWLTQDFFKIPYTTTFFNCKRNNLWRGRRGRDRMVVGFTTTYAISAH
jgi:hypothetical protein